MSRHNKAMSRHNKAVKCYNKATGPDVPFGRPCGHCRRSRAAPVRREISILPIFAVKILNNKSIWILK